MVLFMFIFTLLGLELFAFKVKFDADGKPIEDPQNKPEQEGDEFPRANFNHFLLGFTTIFIVFIGEDWNSVMYDHTRTNGWPCIIIFIFIFIVGNLIMLNLFLAILLKNFEEPPEPEAPVDNSEPGMLTKLKQKIQEKLCTCCSCCRKDNEK